MGSTRAEGRAVGAVSPVDADLVAAAAALRWARPDLTAALADHVLEEASAAGLQDRWLAAAGWAVHARAATGDGRRTACEVLAGLERWGRDALAATAADRLRVELAMVAAGAGEVERARRLLAPLDREDADPELAADLLCAHARCEIEEAPDAVGGALDAAEAAWTAVGGRSGELGAASIALVRAVVERRAGRPAAAVDHAAAGLARLERARSGSGTPSAHLAAALAAEWISALLDAGRPAEARDACSALLPRLADQARPTRQLALLRLTVARAVAAQDAGTDTGQLLAQAAEDAADSDVPDLEAVCRTALGALHEQAGHLEVALETLQLGVAAERRDRSRSRRFAAALAELPVEKAPAAKRRRERPAEAPGTVADSEATMLLPAITRGDRKLKSSRRDQAEPSRFERLLGDPPSSETATGWTAVPWNGSIGDSPIGDLLIRSLRSGSAQRADDTGAEPRNGSAVRRRTHHGEDVAPASSAEADAPDAPAAERGRTHRSTDRPGFPSGWLPGVEDDPGHERPGRARRRARDVDGAVPGGDRSAGEEQAGRRAAAADRGSTPTRSRPGAAVPPDAGRLGRHVAPAAGEDDEVASAPRSGPLPPATAPVDQAARDAAAEGTASGGTAGPSARTDDPWATGRWSVPGAGAPVEAAPVTAGSTVPAPALPGPSTPAATAADSGDTGDWLQAALAELDRALAGVGVGGSTAHEDGPDDDEGCAVVVDIARDGRRFAGPRAAAVVRSVADLLADRLPPGGRSRFGDGDTLVITGSAWSRADATDWMHRTLPGLLDGFVAPEELPGAQLRAAVHDTDGPVGAQILQPLTPVRERDGAGRRRRRGSGAEEEREPWADLAIRASEARGREYRAARAGRQGRGEGAPADRGPEAAAPAVGGDGSPPWPWFGGAPGGAGHRNEEPSDGGTGPARPGRHEAGDGRATLPPDPEAGERRTRHRADREPQQPHEPVAVDPPTSGRRSRRDRGDQESRETGEDQATAARGSGGGGTGGRHGGSAPDTGIDAGTPAEAQRGEPSGREPERPESTEGLGIADLLAGALAAYRGI